MSTACLVLDIYESKDNVELVGWRAIDEDALNKMKKQARKEGGQFLILSPVSGLAADRLSTLQSGSIVNEEQTEREDGEPLILTPEKSAAESLSTLPSNQSSEGKDTEIPGETRDSAGNSSLDATSENNESGELTDAQLKALAFIDGKTEEYERWLLGQLEQLQKE